MQCRARTSWRNLAESHTVSIVEPPASSADPQATRTSTHAAQKLMRTAKRDERVSRPESSVLASQSAHRRALDRNDPTLQVPFWAYASWWVHQAMQQLVAELTRPVVMSDRALRQLAQVRDAHAELQRDGRSPTLAELSDHPGLDHGQLVN